MGKENHFSRLNTVTKRSYKRFPAPLQGESFVSYCHENNHSSDVNKDVKAHLIYVTHHGEIKYK